MPAQQTQQTAAQQQAQAQALNLAQRQAVLSQAVEMSQQVYSAVLQPASTPQFSVAPRNVGLLKKFIVRVTGTVTNTGSTTALALTDFGLSNLFSNITFTDLNNNQRINTAGWHLSLINSVKQRKPYAAGYMIETDEMAAYGENFLILNAPATVPATTGNVLPFAAQFEIPIAYDDQDLRGAVWMNVVNTQAQLNFTFNPTPFSASAADSTFAMWKNNTGSLTNVTVTVYQVYLDQLPIGQGGVVLPMLDLSTIYELKFTNFSGIPTNQQFQVPFSNYRDFLSTIFIYNHDTTVDTGRTGGTDVNYLALQSANFTNLWKFDPYTQSSLTRAIIGTDCPKGTYYMSSRRKPISTLQYGNMETLINPSTGGANAALYVGWEDFGMVSLLTQAGSLAG